MRTYKQLTLEERYLIYSFKQAGFNQKKIAAKIGVHRSTVSRELIRNKSKRGYRPSLANRLALGRRRICRKPCILNGETKVLITNLLQKGWSPEQIAGRLKFEDKLVISHQTIYRYIHENRSNGGSLYKFLRRRRRYRKGYDRESPYSTINQRISIDHRPPIVDEKCRIGDWEVDTIIPAGRKGALISMVDRYSKFTLLSKMDNRESYPTAKRITRRLKRFRNHVHTITVDNGKEFSSHKIISKELDTQVYFAHPYSSWERGVNENTNGLIRQYYPKGKSFDTIDGQSIKKVLKRLNNRPRKTLAYQTPNEIFLPEVALQG